MARTRRILIPIGVGLAGAILLFSLYLGIVSFAESPQHALQFLWQDRWVVIPIILGFGVQTGLYVTLKKRLFTPISNMGIPATLTGTTGVTSTLGMVACCAHHVTDVLPILGLTAAATFLAQHRVIFMIVGLGMTLVGIMVMSVILFRERQKAIHSTASFSTMETA